MVMQVATTGRSRLCADAAALAIRAHPAWYWLTCAGVFVLQAWLIARHDFFVDEWQALQIAVQSPNLAALLANLAYEGHPPLWYLLLRALAAIAGPYAALWLATLLLGFATQGLILFASPFARPVRLLVALCEFILFEYNVVSRGYTLGVTLTFLVAALWPRTRWVWLPIVLLPMVDFLFGVFSAIFVAMLWRERRLWWPGAVLWLAAGLLAAWSVLPAPDVVPVYAPSPGGTLMVQVWLMRVASVLVPWQGGFGDPLWNAALPAEFALSLWAGFVAVCWLQTQGRWLDRLAVFGFLAITLLFTVEFYALMNRHVMLAGVLLIALAWRAAEEGVRPHPAFTVWLTIAAVMGLATAAVAITRPFDTAPEAARQIRALGLGEAHWAAYPGQHAQGVAALTGMQFERLGSECMEDMIRWDRRREFASPAALAEWVVARAAQIGTFYLLTSVPLPAQANLAELARVQPGYDGKATFLYRVGDGTRAARPRLPRCVPGLRPLSAVPLI